MSKAWIRSVVSSLLAETDDETCRRVLEPCGRQCFPRSLGTKARSLWKASSTARAFVERLHELHPVVAIVHGEIHVVYPQCYCSQIRGVPAGEIPGAYCHCSVGWVKELFQEATGIEPKVEALSTLLRGGNECRFRVDLGRSLDEPLR